MEPPESTHSSRCPGKFNEESVAGGFDDAAAMFPDLRIAELAADRPQRGERSLIVRAHEA